MASANFEVRLSVKDAQVVRRALEGMGESGERALKRIEGAVRQPTAGMRAITAAAGEARGRLDALAGSTGALGSVLAALGPAGLAAAAGVGALIAGLATLGPRARQALDALDTMADSADRLGLSVETFQELQYAFQLGGVDAEQFTSAIGKLNEKIGDIALNADDASKETVAAFQTLGVSVTTASGEIKGAEQVLTELAAALAAVEDPATRAKLAKDALGKSAGALIPTLIQGGDALGRMRQEARDLGIVLDESLVRNAAAANDTLDTLARVTTANLQGALVSLAPVLVRVSETFAAMAQAAALAIDRFRALESQQTRTIETRLGSIREQMRAIGEEQERRKREGIGIGEILTGLSGKQAEERLAELEAERMRLSIELGQRQRAEAQRAPTSSPALVAPSAPVAALPARRPASGGAIGAAARSGGGFDAGAIRSEIEDVAKKQAEADARLRESSEDALARIHETWMRANGDIIGVINARRQRELESLGDLKASEEELARARVEINATADREISAEHERAAKELAALPDELVALQDATRDLGVTFTSAFEQAIAGGAEFSAILAGIGEDIAQLALRKAVLDPLLGALSQLADQLLKIGYSALFAPGPLQGPTPSGAPLGSARGNVFDAGEVIPFMYGGVVTKPTLFPMARGVGLMAEAGPEAVMPLQRLPDGRLGVGARGGGGLRLTVINNGGKVSTEERQREDGGMDLTVVFDLLTDQITRPGSKLNGAVKNAATGGGRGLR